MGAPQKFGITRLGGHPMMTVITGTGPGLLQSGGTSSGVGKE